MRAIRRAMLAGSGAAALALMLGERAVAAPTPFTLADGALAQPADVVLAPGRFIDDRFLATLPPGAWRARLMPANALLLRECLRARRIAVAEAEGLLQFTLS